MTAKGCYDAKNSREVMEGILWKLRTGAPWRDIPKEFCPWETAYGRFNRWAANGLCHDFFLAYEAKLIRNGYLPTEVTSALTSIRVELGLEKSAPSGSLAGDPQPKSTWPVMRMEIRSILKSLGVKCTMRRRPPKLFQR